MNREIELNFHQNFEKILKAKNLEHLLPKFYNLRHRIYELIFIKNELYPFIAKKYHDEINQRENDFAESPDLPKPIFHMKNFTITEPITNLVTNYYFTLKEIISLFLAILNKVSLFLEKKDKTPETSQEIETFILNIIEGKYSGYNSETIAFFCDNIDLLCTIRFVRNRLKKDPRGQFIFATGDGFKFKITGNENFDKTTKYIEMDSRNLDGSFTCTLEIETIIESHTKFFIEAFQSFVGNIAIELNR
jgi:hypothetical protein